MSIEALKEQARRHEQKEEWQKALDFYLKAIARLEEKEQPDISLHNRVGDLYTRVGKSGEAVSHYEAAVDLYMEAELPNNAIAVCKKVIRNLPNRHEIHLKMGEIRAHQGFLTDARQSFLTYAELMQAQGDIDDALDALIRFMELAPEDIEMRTALAAQLEQHGRTEEAVEQLIATHQRMVLAERHEEAAGIEGKIQELAPGTDIPPPPEGGFQAPEEGEEFDFASSFRTFGDDDEEAAAAPAAAPAASGGGEVEGDFGEIALSDDDEEEAVPAAASAAEDEEMEFGEITIGSEDEEEVAVGEEEEAEELPLMEFDEEEEGEEEAEELPLMEFGDDEEEEAEEEVAATAADFGEADRGDREDSEYVEDAEELPELEVGELEEIGLGDEGAPPAEGGWSEEEEVAEAEPAEAEPSEAVEEAMEEAAFEEEPAEEAAAPAAPAATGVSGGPAALRELGTDMLEQGDMEEGTALLQQALDGYAAADDVQGAYETLTALTEAHPDKVEYHQRLVEYAFRTNDDTKLTPAYLNLASCLERNGQEEKAQAVYQQVLISDPDNEVARAALGETAEAPGGAEEPAQVASSEDYVDLGSMILDDEEEERTTRWKVAYEEPSGDEAADFAKMLSQFKEKVSENVAADDIKAHYDLGTAYKEMGLVDEAIGEFQAALRASAAHLPTYEMLGQCFLEQGQHEAAVRTLSKGLDQPFEVEDELIGIYYYLGRAHEEMGNTDSAREFYDKIFTLDINFQDVTERLRSLREA